MNRYLPIRRVHAREVLDSRGNPTVEVEVTVGEGIVGISGYTGRAIVPSGASTGKFEAVELRDGEKRCNGQGVQKAVMHVNSVLSDAIVGENALDQASIDNILIKEDGTENKERLGANAILGVSLAVAKAAAQALRIPLYQYMGGNSARTLPMPMMNILNGGRHADNTVDLQEFMIVPTGAQCFRQAMNMSMEVYHTLKKILKEKQWSTGVGDEGGFAPNMKSSRETLDTMCQAIEQSGYRVGDDISFAIDAAASELYDSRKDIYYFQGESAQIAEPVERGTVEMIQYYKELRDKYPIVSLEDGLQEDDWESWKKMTEELGGKMQLVGDDLFVTNVKRLRCGISLGVANAILIKVNQIGTLSETLHAIEVAKKAGYGVVISHRSGETEDAFIADLAVACNAGQIKCGAPCRAERTAKYNQLLRIEEELGNHAGFENPY